MPLLTAKRVVGRNLQVVQDVTQVLVIATVQVGLNSIGYPGGEVLDFGFAHILFEDVGLHPTGEPVVVYIARRAGGCAHLNRWLVDGLTPRFRHGLPRAYLFTRRIPSLLSCTAEGGKS